MESQTLTHLPPQPVVDDAAEITQAEIEAQLEAAMEGEVALESAVEGEVALEATMEGEVAMDDMAHDQPIEIAAPHTNQVPSDLEDESGAVKEGDVDMSVQESEEEEVLLSDDESADEPPPCPSASNSVPDGPLDDVADASTCDPKPGSQDEVSWLNWDYKEGCPSYK